MRVLLSAQLGFVVSVFAAPTGSISCRNIKQVRRRVWHKLPRHLHSISTDASATGPVPLWPLSLSLFLAATPRLLGNILTTHAITLIQAFTHSPTREHTRNTHPTEALQAPHCCLNPFTPIPLWPEAHTCFTCLVRHTNNYNIEPVARNNCNIFTN